MVIAKRVAAKEGMGRVTNVVFMGMGEPLHNVDAVINAVNILTEEAGMALSHNKVTVSTSGLVPEIRRFCREAGGSLAVSLNATTDEVCVHARGPAACPHTLLLRASSNMNPHSALFEST